jgi:beta-N-acetylhexosaminidase
VVNRRRHAGALAAGLVVATALAAGAGVSPALAASQRPAPTGLAAPLGATGSCVDTVLAGMSIKALAGQVVMVGVPTSDPGSGLDAIRQARVGGIFLSGQSKIAAGSLRTDLLAVQKVSRQYTGMPVLVATDQEGGRVQTLSGPGFPAVPSAVKQSTWNAATLTARTDQWARALSYAGVTMDLAPVADTVPAGAASHNPPIGGLDRQYGDTPPAVAARVRIVVTELHKAGVLATVKHFPGLGRVHDNTDTSTHAVDTVTTTRDPALAPFEAGIAAHAAVMVSSARYPKLDPASLAAFSSPIITGLLRGQLGFDGLVMSDDLGVAVAVKSVPVGERAVRFVTAGGDLVLSVRPADAGPMTAALAAAAHGSPAFATRLRAAARSVLMAKQQLGLLHCAAASH